MTTLKAARDRVEYVLRLEGDAPEFATDGTVVVEAADLRLILAALDEQEWRPIDTAPRDGTPALLWYKGKTHVAAYWVQGPWKAGMWCSETVGFGDGQNFTHWRPLPAPPVEVKG
jgi:hypothetical protein